MQIHLKNTVSGYLILIAFLVTFIVPEIWSGIGAYGMHQGFFRMEQYQYVPLQFLFFQFLHGSFFHLLSNAFFLVIIGLPLEQYLGKKKMILFFVFTTIFVGALLLNSSVSTIGMSGFAMAILAYYTLMLYTVRNEQYKAGLVLLILNIVIGLSPQISLQGHLWGAVAGVLYWLLNDKLLKKTGLR